MNEREGLYRALVELSPEALAVRRHGILIYVNPAAVAMFGATDASMLVGKSILQLVHPDFHSIALARLAEDTVDSSTVEMRVVRLDGTPRDVEIQSTTIPYDGESAVLSSLRDITQHKRHEVEIERLNRLYAALSRVNQAIVRVPARNDLFQSVCRILIDHGGMRMARIGWHTSETDELIDVASAGAVYPLQRIRLRGATPLEALSPAGTAFREQRAFVCNDVFDDPLALPWRDSIGGGEFQSCAAFPFRQKGVVSGVLSVYAIEADFFKDKEIALLEAAARDISFGLDNLVRADERRQAYDAAREAEAAVRVERDRAQRYLDTAEVILLALDPEGRITLVNRYACSIFGWTPEEMLGRDFIDTCVPPAIRGETRMKLATVLSGPDSSIVENAIITRGGKVRLVEWRNTLLRDGNGRLIGTLSSGTDLTHRNESNEALRAAEERWLVVSEELDAR